jgi:hypothetical protein
MNIIYYNKKTGTFCEFEIDHLEDGSLHEDTASNNFAETVISSALKEISMWGDTKIFPKVLLETLKDDEINTFMMASFDAEKKEELESCLFALIECKDMKTFLEIDTQEIVASEAIGKRSMILYKEKANEIISAASVSFEDLEEKFIQI